MYANYGREKDFEALKKSNISCSGKIVMMRYGKIGRATKVSKLGIQVSSIQGQFGTHCYANESKMASYSLSPNPRSQGR